jgi:putative pyruvate formate lyase activating enzyme
MTFLSKEISPNTYVNVMAQYHPCYKTLGIPGLGRRISSAEFQQALSLAHEAGLTWLDEGLPAELLAIPSE